MAFDFKKECRAPRMGKSGGVSPAQNAPLTNKCGLRIMGSGSEVLPWNAGPRILKPLFINRDKLMTSGIVWGRRMHRLFCAPTPAGKAGEPMNKNGKMQVKFAGLSNKSSAF